jgi:hypothetical protein
MYVYECMYVCMYVKCTYLFIYLFIYLFFYFLRSRHISPSDTQNMNIEKKLFHDLLKILRI